MRVYNDAGYALVIAHALVSALVAPPELGYWRGLGFGMLYLVFIWLVAGIYLSDVLHLGIAHRALDFKDPFVKVLALLNNTVGIYINPRTWVNRHRHHHAFSDHPGDPNKLSGDGFWKTLYLCVSPYPCESDLARDPILNTWALRLTASPGFAVFGQFSSYALLWLLVRDCISAQALWGSVRVVALSVNMVQNFWTHDRRCGTRRYDDADDNAMNIGDWLPVTATFSASWQNNHHHYPHLLRLSHDPAEYDFGFLTVRCMKALGLVKPSSTGAQLPKDVPLRDLGF
jgi:stearoyl-CoA desaturase (delta-9 desaturase)